MNFLAQETNTLRIVEGEPDGEYWTCYSEERLPTRFFEKRGPEGYKFWCWLDKDNNIVSDENPVPAGRYRAVWINAWTEKIDLRVSPLPIGIRFQIRLKFSSTDLTEKLLTKTERYAQIAFAASGVAGGKSGLNQYYRLDDGSIKINFCLYNYSHMSWCAADMMILRFTFIPKGLNETINKEQISTVPWSLKSATLKGISQDDFPQDLKQEILSWPIFNPNPVSVQSISTQSLEENPIKRKSSKADTSDNDIDISQLITFEK